MPIHLLFTPLKNYLKKRHSNIETVALNLAQELTQSK